jgi:hypothetical protein
MNKRTILLAATILFLGASFSPSHADGSKIEVFRGGNVSLVTTTNSSGVVVLRGTGAEKGYSGQDDAGQISYPEPSPTIVTSGSSLWIVDLQNNEIIECGLRGTGYVGGNRVVCVSGSFYDD